MNSRKNELISYLKACCLNSAIMYHLNDERYVPCIKIFSQTGEVYFISKDRHLSIIIQRIPNWNPDIDIKIIESFNDDDHFHVCEGEKHENKYYTYSVMFIEESQKEQINDCDQMIKKWEYKYETKPYYPDTDWMNRLGEEGWELASVDDEDDCMYFKRPKK